MKKANHLKSLFTKLLKHSFKPVEKPRVLMVKSKYYRYGFSLEISVVFIFVIVLILLISLVVFFVWFWDWFFKYYWFFNITGLKNNNNILLYFQGDSWLFKLNFSSDCTSVISVFLMAVMIFQSFVNLNILLFLVFLICIYSFIELSN